MRFLLATAACVAEMFLFSLIFHLLGRGRNVGWMEALIVVIVLGLTWSAIAHGGKHPQGKLPDSEDSEGGE